MAMGSRLEGEILPGSMPALHEHIGNPLLTKFLNVFYDAGVSDAHSGFRVFTRDALDRLDLSSDGMEFASEMLMKASMNDLRIEEVPIVYHERKATRRSTVFATAGATSDSYSSTPRDTSSRFRGRPSACSDCSR